MIYSLTKKNYKAAVLLGLCVVSHWLLDLVVHIPDLPLYPGNSILLGLGLWKFKLVELLVEFASFTAGIGFYLTSTTAKNKTGLYATWSLIIFLMVIHLMNTFGAAPPYMKAVAWAGQLQWLFIIWAYWSDRNRKVKDEEVHYETNTATRISQTTS